MTATVTIGSFSCSTLTAQPFGYEGEARSGLTARTFRITGLLTPTQWATLVGVYDTWRATRITDADTLQSAAVGTTVSLTLASCNGLTVTSLACWFADPPSGEQVGAYVNVTTTLVDAAQALAVLLRGKEKEQDRDKPSLGTVTLGSCTVTLTKPMETRRDGPSVALTAAGTSYITGPLAAHKIRSIEGYISSGTYAGLLSWYDTTIASTPASSSWFPVSEPTASAEISVSGGVKATRYNVQITALQII
jgi:hypothetical protein